MTVRELIGKLENMDQEQEVRVGCEGYTSEGEIDAYDTDDAVYIVDGCFYKEIDG